MIFMQGFRIKRKLYIASGSPPPPPAVGCASALFPNIFISTYYAYFLLCKKGFKCAFMHQSYAGSDCYVRDRHRVCQDQSVSIIEGYGNRRSLLILSEASLNRSLRHSMQSTRSNMFTMTHAELTNQTKQLTRQIYSII